MNAEDLFRTVSGHDDLGDAAHHLVREQEGETKLPFLLAFFDRDGPAQAARSLIGATRTIRSGLSAET